MPGITDFSAGFGDSKRKKRFSKRQIALLVGVPLAAILFQVYVPRFLTFLAYLELPLLVTLYVALMRRSPVAGVILGAAIGLAQDSLSPHPLGMFGIVKTLVGYFGATFSQRFDVENTVVRMVLSFFFYFFHQFLFWVLTRALLGEALVFEPQQTLVLAILNAAVSAPFFRMLDRLKISN